jgi:hypothetical protein
MFGRVSHYKLFIQKLRKPTLPEYAHVFVLTTDNFFFNMKAKELQKSNTDKKKRKTERKRFFFSFLIKGTATKCMQRAN